MGKHVQSRAWSEFGNKISKQQEGIALKLNHEQIERSISALEDSAHLICNVQIDPKQLNTSLFSNQSWSSNHQEEEWINTLNSNLQIFASKLPTHRRLAVATGIAAFVHKHGNQYGSMVKPLIQSITTLFRHLQQETETQMSLLQFVSFSNIFTRIAERTIEINKLLVFGQFSSKSTLSELIENNVTNQLLTMVKGSFLSKHPTFTQERILQRLINHADFLITQSKSENEACINFPNSCWCSYRKVKVFFPSLPKKRKCLIKQNNFKFKSGNDTYLADGTKAIAITRRRSKNGEWGGLVSLLKPPVVLLKGEVHGFLVSARAVMFPGGLSEKVSVKCNLSNITYLSLPPNSILRLTPGCNYTSNQIQISYPITKTSAKNDKMKFDNIKDFSILHFEHRIDKSTLNMMEMKFSEALLSEDLLQLKLNEIAAQSWFQVFLSRWMEYSLPFLVPAGAAVIAFVTVPVLLYFKCCCCCKSGKCLSSTTCAKNQKTNLSNLEERVSKLETFFEFFIQDRYHHISENDVKQKIVNRKTDKEK